MSRVKTQVDMNRDQFIIDGYPIPSFLKEAEERKAILPPETPDQIRSPSWINR